MREPIYGEAYNRFLVYLGQGQKVNDAADLAFISRSAIYKRRAIDPIFREQMDRIRFGRSIYCPACGEVVA